ncbi:UNVERIFIED_ORG: ABC-type sugar transport system ATPase subunit [Arthrobacter sp. UYEF10]
MGGTNEITGTVRGGVHNSALGDRDLPADTDWPDGPGVIVIRQESISIQDDARGPAGRGVPAIVTDVRVLGPRRLVTVSMSGITLQAEAPWGRLLGTGDAIRLTIPVSARALIADPPGTGGPTTGDIAAAVMATGRT